mgnify:CR=1 FL=1
MNYITKTKKEQINLLLYTATCTVSKTIYLLLL